MKYQTCTKCGFQLVGQRAWAKLSIEARAQERVAGRNRHHGHGLCQRCYTRADRAGTLPERPPFMSAEMVVEEWSLLADRHRSQAANIRLIAPRVGMTEAALGQAILRAKRRGLLERAA